MRLREVFEDITKESKLLNKKTPTVGELAEKYHTSLLAVELQLKKGVKVEMEHTKKHSVAKEIALDHLNEDLFYYEKLAKIEKKTNESCGLNCRCPKCASTNEGQFRAQNVEEFKPSKTQLSDLKSKYLPDWEMLDHRILQANYNAKDHRHAEKFIEVINKISEEMDHFTEVTQDVAEVTVKTTTSDVKGLTLLDFQIAMRIDKMAEKMDIEQIRSKGNFDENFADGKGPGRPGDSARHGIPKGATIAQLEKASKAKGRKGQLARWQLNMRRGKKKMEGIEKVAGGWQHSGFGYRGQSPIYPLPRWNTFIQHHRNPRGSFEDITHYMIFLIQEYQTANIPITGQEIANAICKEEGTNPKEELKKLQIKYKTSKNWNQVLEKFREIEQERRQTSLGN